MEIETGAPPVVRPHRSRSPQRSYAKFFQELGVVSDWVSNPLHEISGADQQAKNTAILQASYARKIKIRTTIQEGRLYARVIPPSESEVRDAVAMDHAADTDEKDFYFGNVMHRGAGK
jgi:hypothetical protein